MSTSQEEFSSFVDRFLEIAHEATGEPVDQLRVECMVESLRDWNQYDSLDDIRRWFSTEQANNTMTTSVVPLSSLRSWNIELDAQENIDHLSHDSGAFFEVIGVRTTLSTRREVTQGWDQPLLRQVGLNGGILGLARQRHNGVPHYLVEAKAEPGNPDGVQISPTVQATFSNLARKHRGAAVQFAELFEDPEKHGAKVLFRSWLSEDGGRLYQKRNLGMIIELAPTQTVTIDHRPGFKWLSLFQLKALIKESSWVSPHVRGIISHL